MTTRLCVIDESIAERCDAIMSVRAWWPCARGCADCCRNLADLPEMTPIEWSRLEEALRGLKRDLQRELLAGVRAMLERRSDGAERVACAFLHDATGACRVYEARPAACRTYGFFVAGPRELWCSKIDAALEEHEPEASGAVMWGNHHAVERKLVALSGPRVTMERWWRERGEPWFAAL